MHKNHVLKIIFLLGIIGLLLLPMAQRPLQSRAHAHTYILFQGDESGGKQFVLPITQGRLTWRYGPKTDPFTKEERFHNGVDVAAKTGTPVRAAADGVVIKVQHTFDENSGYGKNIIIGHADGIITRYAKLHEIFVEVNKRVKAGEKIGAVGSTGKSTGPHLHFELKRNETYMNPEDYIEFSALK